MLWIRNVFFSNLDSALISNPVPDPDLNTACFERRYGNKLYLTVLPFKAQDHLNMVVKMHMKIS